MNVQCCPYCGSEEISYNPTWWRCDDCGAKFRVVEAEAPDGD